MEEFVQHWLAHGIHPLWAGLVIIAALAALLLAIQAVVNGIGPVPTSQAVRSCLRPLLPGRVKGDIFELGAGWGGVAFYLAAVYSNNRVIAVENSWCAWLFCWIRAKLWGPDNLVVVRADIYDMPLDGAGLVYCYLFPGGMRKLGPRLQQAPTGSLLISHTFSVPGMQPVQQVTAADLWRSPLYLYRLAGAAAEPSASSDS